MTKNEGGVWSGRRVRGAGNEEARDARLEIPREIAPDAQAAEKISDWALPLFTNAYNRGRGAGEKAEKARRELVLEEAFQRGREIGRAEERDRPAAPASSPPQTEKLTKEALESAYERGVRDGAAAKKIFMLGMIARNRLLLGVVGGVVLFVLLLAAILGSR